MAGYVSHIRSVLTLLRAPVGALNDAAGLLEGARKLTPQQCRRVKHRVSAEQARKLIKAASEELQRQDVADSWVVARHFCLRYGAEVAPMQGNGSHSKVELDTTVTDKAEAALTLFNRKLQREPVVVVRRCICKLQGKLLCGVCVLRRRWTDGRIFPNVSYTLGLALLKASAAIVGLPEPLTWGTHAFRRGWANEALQAGGPTALFYSGGWKGLAAFQL